MEGVASTLVKYRVFSSSKLLSKVDETSTGALTNVELRVNNFGIELLLLLGSGGSSPDQIKVGITAIDLEGVLVREKEGVLIAGTYATGGISIDEKIVSSLVSLFSGYIGIYTGLSR